MTTPERRSTAVEHTKWSPGLIGFYASCAGVSLGAAIAFGSWFFFRSTSGLVFGCVMSGVSIVTCFFALRAARKPPSKDSDGPRDPSATR